MKNTYECANVGTCPFAFTDASELAQNYACLPTPYQIIQMRVVHGRTWACHNNPSKPCLGAMEYLKINNLPFTVINPRLITQDDDWDSYIN